MALDISSHLTCYRSSFGIYSGDQFGMAPKALFVLAVLLASAALLASSEVAEETHERKASEAAAHVQDLDRNYDHDDGGYNRGGGGYPGGGNGGYPGRGYGGYPGRGYGGYPGGGYPGRGGGYCRYGCCRRGYYGGCRCCQHLADVRDPEYIPEVRN